ncbi:type I methionyl aminopeptidase [Patulibacter sp.]|uniref:type I methionyl aminopeptidase n=1 Tax=Patulibacter sp. TaxID=1912859 RepID=UPI0027272B46|nr:type I methionyl aminopeptidase [Patulibacter sp.]MDO9407279.1 type I methionyl aminopeptidase [Patulibacter sp.]
MGPPRLKAAAEIEAMAASGALLARTLDVLAGAVAAGVTTADLDGIAREHIRADGGQPSFLGYRAFPGSICASPNDLVVHGIPGPRPLADGDVVSLDVGVTLDGWVTDAARTFVVGEGRPQDLHLVATAEQALRDAIAVCVPGGTVGDVGAAVQARAGREGIGVFPTLIGHGVGRSLHEEPQVPNVGHPGHGPELRAGLVIAVEPMLTLGRPAIRLAPDGWSVFTIDGARATHAEVTVAVTDEGPRVLTPWGGTDRW